MQLLNKINGFVIEEKTINGFCRGRGEVTLFGVQ